MMASSVSSRPPPGQVDTLKKIMWLYRTRTCPLNKRNQCNYGSRCFDSHESMPERRPPKQNEYNDWHPSTMKCTSNADENCKYGRACYFAHNDFEVNYHPTMYKTKICQEFEKNGCCNLGMICPNYHYSEEQRKIEKGTLPKDCKSDGISRKAPPPQEFRRWLDEELRIAKTKASTNNIDNNNNTNVTSTSSSSSSSSSSSANVNTHEDSMMINNKNNNIDIENNVNMNKNLNVNNDKNNVNNVNNINNTNSNSNINVNNNNNVNSSNNLKTRTPSPSVHTGNSTGIENEVEIELPSSQPSQSQLSQLSNSDLILKNVSDSVPSSHHSSQPPSTRSHSQHQFGSNQGSNNQNVNMSNQVPSAQSSPYVEPWPQQQNANINNGMNGMNVSNGNNMKFNNQSRAEQYLPSTSPHLLTRAHSTPSTIPSVPHSSHNSLNSPNLATLSSTSIPRPTQINHAHSYSHHPPQTAPSTTSHRSHRSHRSNRSTRSDRSSGGRSSNKSNHSKSIRSDSQSRHRSGKKHKNSKRRRDSSSIQRKQFEQEQQDKQCIDIVKSYKVTRCPKSKCINVFCDNYHDWRDRRRSPLAFSYSSKSCSRIFDSKTRSFTDNCYGCPYGDQCEFAHNYLEIWFHPTIFHTKKCPIIKYQKKCPWGFKCSHYHSKSQKRKSPVSLTLSQSHNNISSQSSPTLNKLNGKHIGNNHFNHNHNNHHYSNNNNNSNVNNAHSQSMNPSASYTQLPPNLPINNVHNHNRSHSHGPGPHRPPLTTRSKMSPQIPNPTVMNQSYSAHSYDAGQSHQNHFNQVDVQNQRRHHHNHHNQMNNHHSQQHHHTKNGLASPNSAHHSNKSSPHDGTYSFNPLMQGIAPSINSWRQKIDTNPTY